jgi:hypothetical protein
LGGAANRASGKKAVIAVPRNGDVVDLASARNRLAVIHETPKM